jgi:tetratricopeptide (TPR) repeat protein
MGRAADALRSIERARALFAESSSLSKNGPSDVRMFPRTRSLQALTLLRLGRLDEAWTEINVALTAGTANMIDGSATGQRDLAETHRHAGAILLARGDLPAALEQLRLSTDVIGKLAETDGAFLVNRVLHAAMLIDYGEALTKARQASPARAAFEKSVSILNTAISEAPSWAALPPSLARATAGLHQLTRD